MSDHNNDAGTSTSCARIQDDHANGRRKSRAEKQAPDSASEPAWIDAVSTAGSLSLLSEPDPHPAHPLAQGHRRRRPNAADALHLTGPDAATSTPPPAYEQSRFLPDHVFSPEASWLPRAQHSNHPPLSHSCLALTQPGADVVGSELGSTSAGTARLPSAAASSARFPDQHHFTHHQDDLHPDTLLFSKPRPVSLAHPLASSSAWHPAASTGKGRRDTLTASLSLIQRDRRPYLDTLRPRSLSVYQESPVDALVVVPDTALDHADADPLGSRGFLVDHAMNLFSDCAALSSALGAATRKSLVAPFVYDYHLPLPVLSEQPGESRSNSQFQLPDWSPGLSPPDDLFVADLSVDDMLRRKASEMSRGQNAREQRNSHRRISAADPLNPDLTLRQQFLSMFQPSTDNKLALKLFGSVTAVTKERERIASSKHWVIHPASNFRFYFDLFMLVILLANLMILPVSIAFFNEDFSIPWIVFNCFSDTIFIIDLVCNFRTGLLNPENASVVILDPKEIAKRYIRSCFFVDLISSIPFDYVVLVISIWDDDFAKSQFVHAGRALRILRMAKLLSLIKLLRLSRLVRYVSQFEEIYFLNIAGVFMRIFNFMCLMMLMAHWSGCIQFLVPMLQGFPRDSWVVINELEHAPWFEQYTWSVFKAISHQLSIGYGRYPPQSISDAWLTVLSMLTGAFTYALFIGHASNLIHSLDASRRQYREKWKQVEEYMAYRKLPRQLRAKISDFYEHRFQGKMFDEEAILSELNDPLRELIINYNCRDLVSSVPFFSHADPNFVTAVITRLRYEFFLPDDVIVREGTLGDKMYFIQEGLVEIYLEPKVLHEEPAVITCLSDGSYFGEICLLTKAKRVASVRAVTCCSLFSLQSDNFNCVLNEYPLMRTALESVAAERLNKIGKDPGIVSQRSRDNLRGGEDVSSDAGLAGSRSTSAFAFPLPTFVDPEAEPGDAAAALIAHSPLLAGSTSADALGRRLEAATQQYRYTNHPSTPRTLSPSNTYSSLRPLAQTTPGSASAYQLSPTPMISPYPDRRLSQRSRLPREDSSDQPPPPSPGGIHMRPLTTYDAQVHDKPGKAEKVTGERDELLPKSSISLTVDAPAARSSINQSMPALSPKPPLPLPSSSTTAVTVEQPPALNSPPSGPLQIAANTESSRLAGSTTWNSAV